MQRAVDRSGQGVCALVERDSRHVTADCLAGLRLAGSAGEGCVGDAGYCGRRRQVALDGARAGKGHQIIFEFGTCCLRVEPGFGVRTAPSRPLPPPPSPCALLISPITFFRSRPSNHPHRAALSPSPRPRPAVSRAGGCGWGCGTAAWGGTWTAAAARASLLKMWRRPARHSGDRSGEGSGTQLQQNTMHSLCRLAARRRRATRRRGAAAPSRHLSRGNEARDAV